MPKEKACTRIVACFDLFTYLYLLIFSCSKSAAQNLLDIDALLDNNTSSTRKPLAQSFIKPAPQFRPAPGMMGRPLVLPKFSLASRSSHSQQDNSAMEVDDSYPTNMDYDDDQVQHIEVKQEPNSAENGTDNNEEVAKSQEEEETEAKISLTKTTKKLKAFVPPPTSIKVKDEMRPLSDISVKTENIFGDQDAPQAVSDVAGKIDPKQWILTRENEAGESENYIRMYWLDAVENNGILYLFGRIPIHEEDGSKRYVSGTVIVHGCERNLFVLPKALPNQYAANGTQARHDMAKVSGEISSLLVPNIIPRQEGRAFKCKRVKRKYAFEHGDTPREETDYLKVVYSAKFPTPSTKQCSEGETYERIFGATSSALELFILKRKLMGPCWIDIKQPRAASDSISWCKVEAHVDNPKFVTKVTDAVPPAPSLVSMCLSIKTAVNPTSHLHEIVAVSGVIHPKVDSDADSEVNPAILRRFTFVRQLGLSCGSGFPANFPHDIQNEVRKCKDIALQTFPNERALLSMFLNKIQQEDPDIFSSHNLLGFELDVLLSRAVANKLPNWSILGKLRKTKPPKSVNDKDAIPGRILCDTYKAAKEFLRETTYSLSHLAHSQLKLGRQEIDPIDVPKYFSSSSDIIQVARHTFWDAWLVQGLMFKLQVVPLTKQLTNLSGNLWSRTIRGARAERIEYLLLHEFHALKYILPERKLSEFAAKKGAKVAMNDDDVDEIEASNRVGGMSRKRAKAAYAGGLVLEPKKGLYDSYILLLDFNSLYPSIIQEYNLCFTTVNWTRYMEGGSATAAGSAPLGKRALKQDGEEGDAGKDGSDADSEDEVGDNSGNKALAPLPDGSAQPGVLPRVIKTLVDRRRQVKNMLKNEKDPLQRQQLDIRQKALKLTANSMYGCLGFSFSRFYARPIAALVTAMGREALQRTVDLATNQLALDVIYGDTDSVMINTGLHQNSDLPQVKELGLKVKKEVNKLYKSLELDLDGIFRSMLLLKKKKYAALVVNEAHDGTVTYEKEMKGLDLVRRDWCVMSKETGKFVVDQILSGESCEDIVMTIHNYLHDLATKIRSGAVDLDQFVITKGLNKNPKDYPDCNGQAHLQVALQMLKANKPVNIGDHIPYVICTQGPVGATAAHRAYHPDEVRRAPEEYTIDYEWYLSNQILPPISRLCEPIEGTSPAILSERLGLDASKYARTTAANEDFQDDSWGFTPKCMMVDSERFKHCQALICVCASCNEEVEVAGVMNLEPGSTALTCGKCGAMFFGRK